ncbi:MAG: hypothetical protein V4732_10165 [Pseudomonadota bacterium]
MLGIKKHLFFVVILCSSASVLAADLDNDCESAVDTADKLGSPISKECDYSNTGLNGVLHRAVANKEKAVVDKNSKDKVNAEVNNKSLQTTTDIAPINSAINNAVKPLLRVLSAEFATVQQLVSARYDLIHRASQDCSSGFVLEKESYLPAENKLLKLQLTYSCF